MQGGHRENRGFPGSTESISSLILTTTSVHSAPAIALPKAPGQAVPSACDILCLPLPESLPPDGPHLAELQRQL